jgi:uncharacterized membrane protein
MAKSQTRTKICQICKKAKNPSEVVLGEVIRESVADVIRKTNPDWSPQGYICLTDLNAFRSQHIQNVLETEKGELSQLEEEVLQSMRQHELLARDINEEFDQQLSLGEHLADRIAEFGGSWSFILIFAATLAVWIGVNSVALWWHPFDPYPFIFLNLILSCLAAVQAPVIMMSQNRQEAKDRLRGEHDYRVNLKAELEIRHLNEKIDHLIMHQWQRLLEIQQIQMELMEELTTRRKSSS